MVKNKRSKKWRRSAATPLDNEPADCLGAALKATRKRKSKDMMGAAAYTEDLGTEGIKFQQETTMSSKFGINVTSEEKRRRKERQMRFANGTSVNDDVPDGLMTALSAPRTPSSPTNKKNFKSDGSIVGTCQNLEKPYLRLTTFPKAEHVRPLEVLKKALQHIKCRYIRDEDFDWANEQLKSVRQDITVQGLKNSFVLDAYETHARILLENGDLNEYNQCQTMIRTLTTGTTLSDTDGDFVPSNTSSDTSLLKQSEMAADEFGGYRLLYALVQNSWSDLTRELAHASHLQSANGSSTPTSACRHAIMVVKAVTHNDYHAFFRLYESAPHLSAYLMDFLVKRVRASAYKRIIASYRPTISVERIREALLFKDLEETREFLRASGAVFCVEQAGEPPFYVDCKASK